VLTPARSAATAWSRLCNRAGPARSAPHRAFGIAQRADDCNAWLYNRNVDGTGDRRSQFPVDGQEAYDSTAEQALFSRTGLRPPPGAPRLDVTANPAPGTPVISPANFPSDVP